MKYIIYFLFIIFISSCNLISNDQKSCELNLNGEIKVFISVRSSENASLRINLFLGIDSGLYVLQIENIHYNTIMLPDNSKRKFPIYKNLIINIEDKKTNIPIYEGFNYAICARKINDHTLNLRGFIFFYDINSSLLFSVPFNENIEYNLENTAKWKYILNIKSLLQPENDT